MSVFSLTWGCRYLNKCFLRTKMVFFIKNKKNNVKWFKINKIRVENRRIVTGKTIKSLYVATK